MVCGGDNDGVVGIYIFNVEIGEFCGFDVEGVEMCF